MKQTERLTTMALMTALALALSRLEALIPLELLIPLPGVRLGLANTVTLFVLYRLDDPASKGSGPRAAALILLTRCLIGALFSGSVTALAFSLTGGALSLLAMAGAKRSGLFSVYGVSVLGAAAHNCGQILAGGLLMHSAALIGYLPYLLLIGTACSSATALAVAGVLRAFAGRKAAGSEA